MNRLVTALLFLVVAVLSADAGAWLAHYDIRQRQAAATAPVAAPVQARTSNRSTIEAPIVAGLVAERNRMVARPEPRLEPVARHLLSKSSGLTPEELVNPKSAVAPEPLQATQGAAPGREQAPSPPNPSSTGVLIVISLPSQRAFVFKDGETWASTRVSTGKPGKRTPVGTFTILEKRLMHRSTRYDDAPMPYMQRITWGGVALHAGRVPGYPASHGCIRLPRTFARRLYGITNYSSTIVRITDKRLSSADEARKLG